MPGPPWLAATQGSPGLASQVNQFLAAHAVTFVYNGATVQSQTTFGSGGIGSFGQYIAQKFTTGAGTTGIGRVILWLGYIGTPAAPLTVSLYADNGGPTGAPLVTTAVPKELINAGGAGISVPVPVAVSPSTAYWIVLGQVGDASDYYFWTKSNQVTGAMTSPDGVTWTAQSYGFYFWAQDNSVTSGGLTHTWEDANNRWTTINVGGGLLTSITEYTEGETVNGYTVASRTLTYSSGTLVGVA